MAKLGVVLKTGSLDFSTYGYIAAAIERLDSDNLRKLLNSYDAKAIHPYIKDLFDLALENIDRAIEDNVKKDEMRDVFNVINELVSSKKFIGDTASKSSLLPKLLDKMIDIRLSSGLSSPLKKDMLDEVESSIVKLSNSYSNKKEFLSTLSNRETLVQDIDLLKEISGKKDNKLEITNEECNSFLKSKLLLMGRDEEWKSLESREKKDESNLDAKQAVLDNLKERNRTLFDLYNTSPDLLSIALSEKRADINNLDEKGFSLLHYACLNCDVELIKDLIKQGAIPTLLSVEGKLSPLNMLSMSNKSDKSVEAFNAFGISSLDDKLSPLLAMKSGNEKLTSALVDASKSKEEVLYTILRRGVQSDDYDLVKSVLKEINVRGIEFKSNESDLKNPDLLEMSMNGNGDAFSALLESGLIKGHINSDLLEKSVLSGNQNAVKAMLSLKSQGVIDFDISVKRKVSNGGYDVNILDKAYRQKVGIENQNKAYKERSHAATPDEKKDIDHKIEDNLSRIEGIYNSINMLLEYRVPSKGVDLLDVNTAFRVHKDNGNKKNFLLETYSELSIFRKDLENDKSTESVKNNKSNVDRLKRTVDNLIIHPSADLMIPDEYGQNILMLAAQQGDTNVFGTVISKMKNEDDLDKALNAEDNYGNTVVFHAAEFVKEDVFDLLISHNAKLRDENGAMLRNNREMTPLMIAAKGANVNIVNKMSPSSRDMIEVDYMGNSPLHYLAMGSGGAGVSAMLDSFINWGANIDAKNIDGKTPLIQAVLTGNADLARKLIEMGADVNAADKYGNTPLIYSCLLNNKEVVESVLSSNLVDVNKANYQGISPYLIVAQRDGLEGLTKNIKSKMGDSIAKDDLEHKGLEVLKKWEPNKYKDLAKVLISRGAEPYISESKSVYDRLISVTSALTLAKFSAEATTLIASSAPGILKLAPNIVKISGEVLASNVVYNEVNKGIQSVIISWLSDGTELDNRISLKDEIMIGSFRDEGFGFVKYGDSLKNGITKHLNFKSSVGKPDSMGIYNIRDLERKIVDLDSEWLLNAHETLTSKYVALQQKIANQPWYYNVFMPWKRMGLNRAAENVLEAHDVIVKAVSGSFIRANNGDRSDVTFEDEFGKKGGLIDLVNLSSKGLMDAALYNIMKSGDKDQKLLKANEVINDVVQKRISVSPKTFYLFSKFALERDRLLNSAASRKDEFVKNYDGKADFALDIDERFVKSLKDRRAAVDGANNKKVKVDDSQAFKSKAFILSSLNYFCQYDSPYELRNDIAGFVGKSAGTLASVYSLSAVDKTYAAAMLNLGVSAVGLLAANPITAAGIAALYVGSQYKDTTMNALQWAGSAAYSYVQDGINWVFAKEEKPVEVRDANIAADMTVNTKLVSSGLKGLLPEIDPNKMDGYKSSIKEEVMKKDEVKSGVVVDNFSLTTGSAIISPNNTTTIDSDVVVKGTIKKAVQDQRGVEALQSKMDEVTKI